MTWADLLARALTIYQREGQFGVEQWAEQPGIAPHTEILFCDACEDDEPHINDICAVCWTARQPAKAALESNANAQPAAEQLEERYEVTYEVTLSLTERDPGPSRRQLQRAIYRETDLDTIDAIEVSKGSGVLAHQKAEVADANALDALGEFLYWDPDVFPGGADTCAELDRFLHLTGRKGPAWLAAKRAAALEAINQPHRAAEIREGVTPEIVRERLYENGELDGAAPDLVAGWC